MMKKIIGITLLIMFCSCKKGKNNSSKITDSTEQEIDSIKADFSAQEKKKANSISFDNEKQFAEYVVKQLDEKSYDNLDKYVKDKILFSPYAHIKTELARKVTLEELKNQNPKEKYIWGVYDGRGDTIYLSTSKYLEEFGVNFDPKDRNIEINTFDDQPKARGSELQNVHKIYPDAYYVEFYLPASEEGGMDWKGLILVIEKENDHFYLQAVLHNQWTS